MFLFQKTKSIYDVIQEYSKGDIEGTIRNAENAQVLTQRENIPILYDYMQNRYPGRGYQASEAVIRSASHFLDRLVNTTQNRLAYAGGYSGGMETRGDMGKAPYHLIEGRDGGSPKAQNTDTLEKPPMPPRLTRITTWDIMEIRKESF